MSEGPFDPNPERFNSNDGSSDDILYAHQFAAVARALDLCHPQSEDITLLLSTCRNEYLTVNAVYVDLQLVLGAGDSGPVIETAAYAVENGRYDLADKRLETANTVLGQAEQKLDVWNRRSELRDRYAQACETLSVEGPLDAAQAIAVLQSGLRVPSERGWVWDASFLDVSLTGGECASQLELLTAVLEEAQAACRVLDAIRHQPRSADAMNLFGDADWHEVQALLLSATSVWGIQPNQEVVALPANAVAPAMVIVPATHGADTDVVARDLSRHVLWVANRARLQLRDTFRPNVARTPMPDPYVIDLTMPKVQVQRRREPFRVIAQQLNIVPQPSNITRLAVLGCHVPEPWFGKTEDYVYDPALANFPAITRCLTDAIDGCADLKAPILVVPEYFIPRRSLESVIAHAAARDVAVIGGLEARRTSDGRSVNEAMVFFPGSTRAVQRKQGPSIYELKRSRFAGDGLLSLFRNTPLGMLAVVVCSDYLEGDIMAELGIDSAAGPDTIIVCSRNPRPSVFKVLAEADAIRLYCQVVVANAPVARAHETSSYAFLALPRTVEPTPAPQSRTLTNVLIGDEHPSIFFWDLDMVGLLSRDHRKVQNGWLPPSDFIQRS